MASFKRDVGKQEDETSNEVQELIGYRPNWMIRHGNELFFLILLIVVAFTCFINYPDIIKGRMKLIAVNAPKLVVARTGGALQRLLVKNEQDVHQGQPLAFLQSTGSHLQVMTLRNLIRGIEPYIEKDSLEILLSTSWSGFDQLGEIQSAYEDFQNILKGTMQVLANGFYQKKWQALHKDLSYLSELQSHTVREQQLVKQDYELQLKEYAANQQLAKDSIIAPLELNQTKSKVIGKEQNLEQISNQLVNNQITRQDKRKEMLELQIYVTDQQQKFRSALFTLKSKIDEWIHQYVVTAPENGKVLFVTFLQENQLLYNGEELFYVQPGESMYYGEMFASQYGLGKIQPGQRVIVRVESYPSNEFGYLSGRVNYISNMPNANDSFMIKVDLPKGLNTNYNKPILFRNNLAAEGEILTDNRKLIDRFFGQLRDMTKR